MIVVITMQGLERAGQRLNPLPLVAKRYGSHDLFIECQADLVGGDTQHLPFRS